MPRFRHNSNLNENAKALRRNMTKEEKHLWYDYLSKYPIRFMRQKIIGNYIVDFYCSKAKLVIEIDGAQHYEEKNLSEDKVRTKYLEEQNLKVIRILNRDVNQNFKGICEYIDVIVRECVGEIK